MYPGLIQPTVTSLRPGATSPRDDAYLAQKEMNATQNNVIRFGGKKRTNKNRRGGSTSTVVVPQFQMLYTPAGGSDPNPMIANALHNSMQSAAWSANDNQAASLNGGSRRRRKKGGNPNWKWGCYSGGKKHRTHHKNKKCNRKTRKCRRR